MSWHTTMSISDWSLLLGQTVLHSLWQGALVGLLVYVLLGIFGKKNPVGAYWLSVGGLLLLLGSVILTFGRLVAWQEFTMIPREMVREVAGGLSGLQGNNAFAEYSLIGKALPFLGFLWIGGVLLLSAKFALDLIGINRLRASGTRVHTKEIKDLLEQVASKFWLNRSIGIVESIRVKTPLIMGHLKPVLLFPLGALASMPISQVEAIIAHELAHIKRKDYLVNIILALAEILLFYHPAIWFLQKQAKKHREIICDDMAVDLISDRISYAKALVHVAELAQTNFQLAPGMSGNKNHLYYRIERLQKKSTMKNKGNTYKIFTSFIALAGILFVLSSSIQPNEIPAPAGDLITAYEKADTTVHLTVNDAGKDYEVVMKWSGDKIHRLSVDGKRIKSANYKKYSSIISKTKELAAKEDANSISMIDIEGLEEIEEIEIEEIAEIENIRGELREVEELIEIEELEEIREIEVVNVRQIERISEIEVIELSEIAEEVIKVEELELPMIRVKLDSLRKVEEKDHKNITTIEVTPVNISKKGKKDSIEKARTYRVVTKKKKKK